MKNEKLKFYLVDKNYLLFLKKFDDRIMDNFAFKEKRPYLGIVLKINDYNYLVPLTSPKPKHLKMKNQIDFLKIENGEYGAINFNNMFPIKKGLFFEKNIKEEQDEKYKILLQKQLRWCNEPINKEKIYQNAEKIYKEITIKKEKSFFWKRCCNFSDLEIKIAEFESIEISSNIR